MANGSPRASAIGASYFGTRRRFLDAQPSTPLNTAYSFREKQEYHPLGVGYKPNYEAQSVWWDHGQDVGFFDSYSLEDFYRLGNESNIGFNQISIQENSISILIETRGYPDVRSSLKASGKYLVEEFQDTRDGSTQGRCYYFIPEYHGK